MNGGRFDFDDGGTYCGGWEEGKAHGHGICTGPDSQGEYAGVWHYGFEVSGIYIWPSGSSYSGQWQNGKRHGLGVEQRGRWIYKGEWTQGFKGRYGRREALNSGAHYLGTWSSGLHDGYGTEVYADGGSYKGQWFRGMRHGYGIRSSAAFENASKHRSRSNTHASLTSLRSTYEEENGMDATTSRSMREKKSAERQEMRGGFVLKARSSGPSRRRRSLSERSLAVKRTILSNLRIKKQHSTGDIHQRVTSTAGSLRSSGSTISCTSDESDHRHLHDLEAVEEKVDPHCIETYKGEWKNDARSGYGICERTDGLRYVGEWLDNKKHGYGVTYFKDGTKEEGRYKNNVLVSSIRRRGIFFVRTTKLRERVEGSVETAKRAAEIAAQRVDIALSRTMTAQERADQSILLAERAKDDAESARIYCAELNPGFRQPGIDHIRQSRGVRSILQNSVYANHVSFESTTSAIPSSLPPHLYAQKPQQAPTLQQQYQFTLPGQQTSSSSYQFYNHSQKPGSNSNQQQPKSDIQQQQTPVFFQQQSQIQNPRVGDPQHQLDSGNGGGAVGYFGGQKLPQNQTSYNPETTSTSGYSQTNDANQPHVPSSNRINNSVDRAQFSISNPSTNLPHSSSQQNVYEDRSVGANQIPLNTQQLQQANYPSSEAGPSTSKLMGNSVGGRHTADDSFLPTTAVGAPSNAPPPASSRLAPHRRQRPERMSTMSLSDDHFDQYTMKKASTTGADVAGRTILEELGASTSAIGGVELRLRRNRPSLTRQSEVNEANLNRRSTLASARDRVDQPIDVNRLYLQHNDNGHPSGHARAESTERGSLPNLDELISQEVYLKREEAARLASQRRQEAQRLLEEEERLHQNPLRYLYHPALRNWLATWKWPILLIIINILLFYYLMHLLAAEVEKDEKHE